MKKSKIKQEFEILNSAISSLAARVKEIEGNTKQINEPLSELPEKWCVKDCEEVSNWASCKYGCEDSVNPVVSYLHVGDTSRRKQYAFLTYIDKGYTEISFSDFERLVLKKGELEVGKWYCEKNYNWLVFRSDESGNGYGLNKSKWQDMMVCTENTDTIKWELATNEEVESALIEEAKRRGFKEGVINNIENIPYTPWMYDYYNNRLFLNNWCIFENAKWANIVEEPKQEIDWSVPGQLVCNENGAIWLTSGKHYNDSFEGTLIISKNSKACGYYSEKISKNIMELYKGSITLSNEPI